MTLALVSAGIALGMLREGYAHATPEALERCLAATEHAAALVRALAATKRAADVSFDPIAVGYQFGRWYRQEQKDDWGTGVRDLVFELALSINPARRAALYNAIYLEP